MLTIVNNFIKILNIEIFLGSLKSIVFNAPAVKCTLKFTLLFKKIILIHLKILRIISLYISNEKIKVGETFL